MLKNILINFNKSSLLSWVEQNKNYLLKETIIVLIKGKERFLTGVIFFIVVLISISLMYKSLTEHRTKEMFSHLKPSIPILPSRSNRVLEINSRSKQAPVKAEWQAIDTLLASNDKRREKLFKKLKLDSSEYIIACVITNCGDCDEIALELNKKANVGQIIAISNSSLKEANEWKTRLGIKFRVESVSSELFDDSGVVILPTLIRVKDFKAIGVSEDHFVID